MAQMLLKVGFIAVRQGLVPDNQEIFRVIILGASGEIERSGDNCFPIDYHNLIMSSLVGRINPGGHSGRQQERQSRKLIRELALVQDDFNQDPPAVSGAYGIENGAEVRV